jgi:two-component system KDP operon response regulator KdpE
MGTPTILVFDDEPQIRLVMRTTLSSNGYSVLEAWTGADALELVRKERPELLLLDVNMPGTSGLDTCRETRDQSDVAILILTVRNTEHDKVLALDAGADDYVVKPFGIKELLARIRAALRRTSSAEPVPTYVSDDLGIDFERRKLLVQGWPVRLTPKEFELLRHLVASQGKPLELRRLLQADGDRITATRPSICAYSSACSERKSSPIPPIRNTFVRIRGLAVGLSPTARWAEKQRRSRFKSLAYAWLPTDHAPNKYQKIQDPA